MKIEPESWDVSRDGALTEEAMRRKMRQRGYDVSCYTYPPGLYFPEHTHGVDKLDGVLSGSFRMSMGGRSFVLEAGDMLFVPRGAPHSAEVLGDEAVVSLDGIKR